MMFGHNVPLAIRSKEWPLSVGNTYLTLEQHGILVRLTLSIWANEQTFTYDQAVRFLRLRRNKAQKLQVRELLEIADRLTWRRVPVSAQDRRTIYNRSHGLCWYCRCDIDETFHVDHATPVSRGGRSVLSNYRPSCRTCNSRKRAMTEDEFFAALAEDARD